MKPERVAVVGAGIGGLSAALELAARGLDVVVLERAEAPGGKVREVVADGRPYDAGPTVFTMRWVFDELFAAAGARFDDHVVLEPLPLLARHGWQDEARLDLFADLDATVDAIGAFAGAAEAQRYRAFAAYAQDVYATLERPYLRDSRPSPFSLARRVGFSRLRALARIRPFTTLWRALGDHFRDPRLRQLFGRYATYCGSSPFAAPATLMLVAHVERCGVWRIGGGMHRLARALAELAERRGARIRYGADVAEVCVERGRVAGLRLADGERIEASRVVFNGDAAALASGRLGAAVRAAVPALAPRDRSLSACVWTFAARVEGFPLAHHSVFFSRDYAAEFTDLLVHRRLPGEPTVYVCAQDRGGTHPPPPGPERVYCLVNAPPQDETAALPVTEIESCQERAFALLRRCGLALSPETPAPARTTPRDFARLFPGTGGALYGAASHGWRASFRRPAARTRVPGLYLAGGSTHPGPGVPMAALSARIACAALFADLASTPRWFGAAMPGGMSTR